MGDSRSRYDRCPWHRDLDAGRECHARTNAPVGTRSQGRTSWSAPTGDPAELAAEQRIYLVSEKLQIISEGDDAYASMALAAPESIIYIYRAAAPTTVSERDYRALVPTDIAVQFLPALMSLKQTQQLQALVLERTQWLTDHGVEISSFGGGGFGGPYVIGYAERTPPDNSLLKPFEIFGAGTIVFEHMERGRTY